MIRLLQEYLKINTAHPDPDYSAVIALFKNQALKDGLLVQEIILPSGNPVLVITLQGTTQMPALLLNHHMDVVPANNVDEWKFPPFAATVDGDYIYGRGAQDCKGLGIVHYGALRALKQSGIQLQRTVHLAIVPDEEVGGFHGTKEFIQHPLYEQLHIGYVLDEGMPSGNSSRLLIKIDERTPLQIRVSNKGAQGHASKIDHENCIHALVHFLSDVATYHEQHKDDFISMHITSLQTNMRILNVIPSQASATLDIRVPSPMSMHDGITIIEALIDRYKLVYEIVATSDERYQAVSVESIFYKKLAQAIHQHGLEAQPFAFEATTDARFYSHQGIEALGFTPFTIAANLHGTDESIQLQDLLKGIEIVSTFLQLFC